MVAARSWTADTPELLTATRWDWMNRAWLYLVAEATPDNGWDWAVWSSDNSGRSLAGVAGGQAVAMAQAEQAAASIASVRVLATA